MLKRLLLAAAVLIAAGSFTLTAAEKPAKPQPALIQKTYAVADLVVPYATALKPPAKDADSCAQCVALGCPMPQPCAEPTKEAALIKLITSTVRPQTWSEMGGRCRAEYYPVGMALVVSAPADVQEQVADLLESLRRMQDVQVAVEIRVISVTESFFERIGVDCKMNTAPKVVRATGCDGLERVGTDFCKPCDAQCPACPKEAKCDPPKAMFLNDCQAHALMEAVQGDRRANVMTSPKVMTMNGQAARIKVGDTESFVTGVKVETVNGQVVMVPENKTFENGVMLEICPTVSADRKFVNLHLKGRFSEKAGEMKLHPVTTMVTPKFEGGFTGQPIPFTQFIQQPSYQTLSVNSNACVPDGGTVLVDAGTMTRTAATQTSVPVLSKIPYINRLFKTTGYHTENYHMLVLATPRVIVQPEAQVCAVPAKKCCEDCPMCRSGKPCGDCCKTGKATSEEESSIPPPKPIPEPMPKSARDLRIEKMAAKLVEKYHKALAAGEEEKARKYARQALDLDPACFGEKASAKPTTGAMIGTCVGSPAVKVCPNDAGCATSPSTPLPTCNIRPVGEVFSRDGFMRYQAEQGMRGAVMVPAPPVMMGTGVNSNGGLTGTVIPTPTAMPAPRPVAPMPAVPAMPATRSSLDGVVPQTWVGCGLTAPKAGPNCQPQHLPPSDLTFAIPVVPPSVAEEMPKRSWLGRLLGSKPTSCEMTLTAPQYPTQLPQYLPPAVVPPPRPLPPAPIAAPTPVPPPVRVTGGIR